ncbi:hypothetical protein ACKFKG_26200 [Phormidesmis sp. 146-35]
MESLRGFEVTSPSEEKVQLFLERIDAVDTSIEWGWNTAVIGHEDDPDEFQGFGYTSRSPEELNQVATLLDVNLVYIDEPLEAETARILGLQEAG